MADYLSVLKDFGGDTVGKMQAAGMSEPWHLENLASQIGQTGGPTWGKYATALGAEAPGEQESPVFDLPTLTPESGTQTQTSGIDWAQGPGPALLEQLTGAIGSLPQQAQNFGTTLQNQYSNLMRQGLGPQAFQGTLNQLANRGMLGSTEAGSAMSRTATDIMNTIGDRGYESQLQGLQQQMQLPGLLGQLASSIGGQTRTQTDPMEAYRLIFGNYV